MSTLRDHLGRLLTVPGVRAAVVVGREGLPVDAAGRGDQRFFDALGALGASALGTTEALGHDLDTGATVGTLLEFDGGFVSIDPLGEFAAVVTLADGPASLTGIRQLVRGARADLLRALDTL
ncbi:MAG TPA: roadblock/LC7 domain-containing protein [Ktedonobacterales bacterium]|jgi:hypothetical protein